MANGAKLVFGILVLVAIFAIATSWSSRAGTTTLGPSAVAGTSTAASATPFSY